MVPGQEVEVQPSLKTESLPQMYSVLQIQTQHKLEGTERKEVQSVPPCLTWCVSWWDPRPKDVVVEVEEVEEGARWIDDD